VRDDVRGERVSEDVERHRIRGQMPEREMPDAERLKDEKPEA
jgi:hypothetical protein